MTGSRSLLTRGAMLAALILAVSAQVVCDAAAAGRPRPKVEIKIATLAPEGSTWMRLMEQLDAEVRDSTASEVGFRFYPGGVQGDEAVVLRKIRLGQLHGGGFTGVGLGEIAPDLRVMEVPFFFRTTEEVRAVQERMGPVFEQELRGAGFELLGWSDVGFVYLFTKSPIRSTEDLRKVRMWLWEGDPLAEAFLKTLGVSPVPLPITDVVTSLQTGLIDAVYTSTLACIALQWFTRVSHMTDLPVTHAQGAVVVSRQAFEQISPAAQATVKRLARKYFDRLAIATTKDNETSAQVLAEKGIKVVALTDAEKAGFEEIGRVVREKLAATLYQREILDRTMKALEEARTAAGAAGR